MSKEVMRLREAAALLSDWYREAERPLPWRESPTPYHVWLSEIMLQQTRIEAVIPYYERFTRELPDVAALSQVDDEKLMKLAYAAAETVNPGHSKIGRIASGDLFVAAKAAKEAIIEKTSAQCTEMEGAAIAHTAYRNGVPFVIIRAISDKADDSAEMDYPTFERIAAHRCAQVTCLLAKALQ